MAKEVENEKYILIIGGELPNLVRMRARNFKQNRKVVSWGAARGLREHLRH